MIPKERILEKLDGFFRENDTSSAKRLLEYWLGEAEWMHDGEGILLMENELMGLCRKLGEEEKALGYAEKALLQVEKIGIENNVGAATTYLNSATVLKAFGRARDAVPLYEKAREIYERELSEKDPRLAGLYNNMALALVDLRSYREAEVLYEKALAILEGDEKSEPEKAITYLNMASAAEAEKGLSEARESIRALCQKARDSLELGKERSDGGYAFVCEKCASVFGYYDEEEYAAVLTERCRRIYEGA